MPATCPSCGTALKPFLVRSHFVCPSCSAQLHGRTVWPLVLTIILWQLADIFIYPLFQTLAGDSWQVFVARTFVSACIGFPLYALLVKAFATIEVSSEQKPTP